MAEEEQKDEAQSTLTFLAILGWVLPAIGLFWGPGAWWLYVLWILVGTVILVKYERAHPRSSSSSS